MSRKIIGILVVGFLVAAATSAYGTTQGYPNAETSWLRSWVGQQTATGTWNGVRSDLEEHGVTISSNFTTDICGNPSGGLKQRTTYSGFLDIALALDFEKFTPIKGMALTVSNYLASGNNLSNAVGNFYGVQEIYAPGNYYLGEIDLSQSLFNDTVTLEIGRLFAGDVFASSPLWLYYVNGGINDHLGAISSNIFFPAFQVAAWAARVSYEPNEQWHFIAGMYNADPNVAGVDKHGADFDFSTNDGYLAIGQLTYKNYKKNDKNNLPGSICFGGYYESSKFTDIADPSKVHRGTYGLYMIFDQMIYRGDWPEFEGPHYMRSDAHYAERAKNAYHPQTAITADRPKGLTLWGAAYIAPQENINTQTYQLTGGLMYQGLPPNRDHDVTAFCVIVGHFSDKLSGQGIETILEINHRVQAGPWLYITPDIQYVINPNGEDGIRDALVLGLEISATF